MVNQQTHYLRERERERERESLILFKQGLEWHFHFPFNAWDADHSCMKWCTIEFTTMV